MGMMLMLLATGLTLPGATEVVIPPAPEGVPVATDWTVRVNGEPVPVYRAMVFYGGPAFFCSFDADGPVRVEAQPSWPVRHAAVRPLSRGITPAIERHVIAFDIDKPGQFSVEPNGLIAHPLFVFANPIEEDPPDPDDPDALYFGPGLHEVDTFFALEPGQEVYLAGGAWLRAVMPQDEAPTVEAGDFEPPRYRPLFHADDARDVTIRGRGVIDMNALDWLARVGIHLNGGSNVRIEGITILDGPVWSVLVSNARDVRIENVKIIGHRESNDGINLVSCRDALVRNVFTRTGDDGIVLKTSKGAGESHNVRVEQCVIWNDKVRAIGITSFAAEPIRDVIFREIDIIHDLTTGFDQASTMAIWLECRGPVTDILFDNIRCEDTRGKLIQLHVGQGRWAVTEELGYIKDVTFRDVVHLGDGTPQSILRGNDPESRIENIRFESFTLGDRIIEDAETGNVTLNDYVYEVTFVRSE